MTLPNILREPAAIRGIAEAGRPGLVLDFDGTLAEIAGTPEAAVINPRCAAALAKAVRTYTVVAVLSGRAVQDVADRVAIPDITYVGNHGAEYIVNGRRTVESAVPTGISQVVEHLRKNVDVPGIVYEDKRFSASVHFRQVDNVEDVESRLRRALDTAPCMSALEWFWGRMILEIRSAGSITKGHAIAALTTRNRLDSLLFAGDDTTDIDGMNRLSILNGVKTVGVAVTSPETPPPLLEAADYVVNGVEEVADLLELVTKLRRI